MRSAGKKKSGGGGWLLFWLAFIIGITILFALNLERIKETLRETSVLEKFFPAGVTQEDPEAELERHIQELAAEGAAAEAAVPEVEAAAAPAETERVPEAADASQNTAETAPRAEQIPLDETAAQIAAQNNAVLQNKPEPGEAIKPAAKTVERLVYMMKVDSAGSILWTSVKRNLPAGDSPMLDALNALIKGPSAEEQKQGLISLIPRNVRIRNATVRGSTAYINFSEDFLFNTYGVEGYAGQRQQIVLTATEFSNVKDVQILIEGKRVDYLGEGVWIGSPVGRDML